MKSQLSRRDLVAALMSASIANAAREPLVLVLGPQTRAKPNGFRIRFIPVNGKPSFPPSGTAYRENGEAHRIWRSIHALAPSLVVDPNGLPGLGNALGGKVPVAPGLPDKPPPASQLANDLAERLGRTPHQLSLILAKHYGHELNDVVYIPAFACMARLRLGALADIEQLAAPYVDGRKDSLAKPTSSHLPGHLLFAALYQRTKNRAYLDRVLAAANLGFTAGGTPRESMPFHDEMSDSVFMGCPILGQAARLTGESRYQTMAVRHLQFMEQLCLRSDGLYRHSPLNEAAWGRGNAFPALGMALLLETMPRPDSYVLDAFRKLIRMLARYQDSDGLWHQVIDRPDSYAEFSATAMIAAAVQKGIRRKWLQAAEHQKVVDHAWLAIRSRTWNDGVLLDVCESTGKQKTLEDYFARAAVWGKDQRGGAMALLLATELMGDPEPKDG